MSYLRLTVLTVCVSFFAFSSLQGQGYTSAVGARLGSPFSATYKTFINDAGHAIEGTVGFRSYPSSSWISAGAAYQLHNDIASVDGLAWYYGGGLSAYFWTYDDNFINGEDNSNLSLSVLGYLGLDYQFANAPINLSVDWTPGFALNGGGFGANSGALAVRYILN